MKKLLILTLALFSLNAQAFDHEVKVYDHVNIDENRMLVLKGEVSESSVTPLIEKLTELDTQSNKPIYLILNSPGGSVTDGFALANAMDSARSSLVCIVDTKAYSMAAILMTFCDVTYIHRFANVMFHEASFNVQGSESTVEVRTKFILEYLNELHTHVANNLHMKVDDYKAKIHKEWWMTATQAAKAGLVNGIINKLQYKYKEPEKGFSFLFGQGDNGNSTPDVNRYFDLQFIYIEDK